MLLYNHQQRTSNPDAEPGEWRENMKKLIIVAMIAALTHAPQNANIYTMPGVYHSKTQTVTDIRGEEWEFDAKLKNNVQVVITFDSRGTYNMKDDVVLSLRRVKR